MCGFIACFAFYHSDAMDLQPMQTYESTTGGCGLLARPGAGSKDTAARSRRVQ